VSYDNSISAIRTNIINFRGGKDQTQEQNISAEEKPNKPHRDGTTEKPGAVPSSQEVTLKNVQGDPRGNKSPLPGQLYQTQHKYSKSSLPTHNPVPVEPPTTNQYNTTQLAAKA